MTKSVFALLALLVVGATMGAAIAAEGNSKGEYAKGSHRTFRNANASLGSHNARPLDFERPGSQKPLDDSTPYSRKLLEYRHLRLSAATFMRGLATHASSEAVAPRE